MALSKAHNLSQPCRRWLVSLLRASITRVRPPYPTLPYPTPATTVAPSFFFWVFIRVWAPKCHHFTCSRSRLAVPPRRR